MTGTYKIKPILIDSRCMHKFYQFLLNTGFEIKAWDKNKNKKIYNYFLPAIREFMFWTFDLKVDEKFKAMDNEMKAAVCNNYSCTMFQSKEALVICFYTGVVFIVVNNEKGLKKLADYEDNKNIEDINIDKYKVYKLSSENEEDLYTYIIALYKYVSLMKLDKEMDNENAFDKNRKLFVKFVKEIYNKKITDETMGNKLLNKWEEELEIEKVYISVENKFDLLYRNNKLNLHDNMIKFVIVLLIILIIISAINLGNWMS